MRYLLSVLALITGFAWSNEVRADDLPVDVELMLAVDVSYSMSAGEQEIQRQGYAAALRDPDVFAAIQTGYHQRVALTYIEWSGVSAQRTVVPWTLIDTPDDLAAFAAALTTSPPVILRRTSISALLDYAPGSFAVNGFVGERRVIDVSGDGPNNIGGPIEAARDALVASGFVINGLPLMTREGAGQRFHLDDLDLYYAECVIGGPLSFSIPVRTWQEFPSAVRRKLVLELAGHVPPDLAVTPTAWSGVREKGYDCLIGEKIWEQFYRPDQVLP
ncbi:hypothetical protein GCM10011316_35070 [Roseibium aquae]|uniref:DUF1194 domain-containing protein n=1 Tax=Roseibium aquae TaxID=1323746 RepID=A0A916X390_9HYPH|nr:DUF1194 domain-containing protein [Roseibium aquae]GGB60035.1 hypothetical protein GCM10011316_35070 [Roseibium aquae]